MKSLFNIEDALSLKVFTGRVPIDFSPDGRWLAYSVQSHSRQGGGGDNPYIPTGVMIEMANSEIWVTDVQSGESQNLTPDWGSSWAPRWSPDGEQLAFYSDRKGKAQLWVWHRKTGQARPVCEEVVRTFFGFEVPCWTPDGTQIICKLCSETLPAESLPKAKTSTDKSEGVTVQVWEYIPKAVEREEEDSSPQIPARADRYLEYVAIVTVATGQVRRLMIKPRPIEVSPDGTLLAVMSYVGMETRAAQQSLYDLYIVPLNGNPPRRLVKHIRQAYGISVSWSPDGRYLAYTTSGQLAKGDVYVANLEDGKLHNLTIDIEANLGNEEERPLWSADGKHLFCAAADGNLWQISLDGNSVRNLTEAFDRKVAGAVHPSEGCTIWSPDHGRSVCVQTYDTESKKHGFYQIDLTSGKIIRLLEEDRWYGGFHGTARFHLDVSADGKSVVYMAEDAKHPADMWIADSTFQNRRQITKLNPQLENMAFGEIRLISWQTSKGKRLRGVLLLPADYVPGQRYPLITRIYGRLGQCHCG